MKATKKIVSTTLASALVLSTGATAFAAIPTDTVVVGENAYNIDYMNSNDEAISNVLEALKNDVTGDLTYKLASGTVVDVETSEIFDTTTYPALNYYDAQGNMTKYEAGDGDVINPVEEVTVVRAEAINRTTVEVEFSEAIAAPTQNNFSLATGNVNTVSMSADNKTATIKIDGLNFGQQDVLTVSNIKKLGATEVSLESATENVEIPDVNELYQITFEADTTDMYGEYPAITADGKSTTMITAKVFDKTTGEEITDILGAITFTVNPGSVGKDEQTIQNGEATVQVTSNSSPTTVYANLRAEITTVQNDEYKDLAGLDGTQTIAYVAEGDTGGITTSIAMTSAEADQADRLFVKFGTDIPEDATFDASKFTVTNDNAGPAKTVKAINKISTRTIELILDTDTSEAHRLIDNEKHTVKVTGHQISESKGISVATDTAGKKFIVTDTSRQLVTKVEGTDQKTIVVTYNESVAKDTDGTDELWDATNPANYILDGVKLKGTDVASIKVGTYTSADNDKRNIATITLTNDKTLSAGMHNFQVKNVGDWAGTKDPANRITTQTFNFTPEIDTTKPEATIVRQSPEQFLIDLQTDVQLSSGFASLSDVVDMFYGVGKLSTNGLQWADSKIKYTALDKDKYAVASNGTFRYILVELEDDWTKKLNSDSTGKTYFDEKHRDLNFKITEDSVESLIGNDIDAVTLELVNSEDATSPIATSFTDLAGTDIKEGAFTLAATANKKTGAYFKAVFNEPMQFMSLQDANTVDTTKSTDPLTPSEDQNEEDVKIPRVNLEFVNKDTFEKIPADVVNSSINEEDTTFVFQPANTSKQLPNGTWELRAREMTDDIGNAMATQTEVFVVNNEGGSTETNTDTYVSWAKYTNDAANVWTEDDTTQRDIIEVKFSKEMSISAANGINRPENWKINGQQMPQDASILKGIRTSDETTGTVAGLQDNAYITDSWDGITIVLPEDYDNELGTNENLVLTLASNFEAADGEKLSGENELDLVTESVQTSVWKNAAYKLVDDTSGNLLRATKIAVSNVNPVAQLDGKYDTFVVTWEGTPETAAPVLNLDDADDWRVNGVEPTSATTVGNKTTIVLKDSDAIAVTGEQEINVMYNNDSDSTSSDGTFEVVYYDGDYGKIVTSDFDATGVTTTYDQLIVKSQGTKDINLTNVTVNELYVDAPNATVVLGAGTTVNELINIENISASTLEIDGATLASGTNVVMSDSDDDGRILVKSGTIPADAKFIFNSGGTIEADSTYTTPIPDVLVNESASDIKVKADVNNMQVKGSMTITNEGTITKLTVDENATVTLDNEGSGEVTTVEGKGDVQAPDDASKVEKTKLTTKTAAYASGVLTVTFNTEIPAGVTIEASADGTTWNSATIATDRMSANAAVTTVTDKVYFKYNASGETSVTEVVYSK